MGISRSPIIVCAYLVETSGMLVAEAIAHVRIKRRTVCPNLGFRKQLATYEQQLEKRVKGELSKGQSLSG